MHLGIAVPTTYATEIRNTYFEIYIYQESCPLALPLSNFSTCQSELKLPVNIWQIVYIYMTAISPKDHCWFRPYTPIFLIPRTLLLSFWCDACSINAIGESNGKSQQANYFKNSYAPGRYGGYKGEVVLNFMQ